MAEPLSVGASIVAVLQLTATVYQYLNSVTDATEERARVRDGLGSACTPLYMLRDRLDEANQDPLRYSSLNALGGPNGPLIRFQKLLEQVASKLAPGHGRLIKLKEARQILMWPFRTREVETLLRAMESYKSLFQLALQDDTISLVKEITDHTLPALSIAVEDIRDGVQDLNSREASAETWSIIKWISPLNFIPIQESIYQRSKAGTGLWLLDSIEFIEWLDTEGGILWCPGDPGAGKTTLMSIVIERLHELYKHQTDNSVGIAYVYCDHKETDTQTTANLLASIWMQLVQSTGTISDKARALYRNDFTKESRPSLRDISDLLKDKVQTYRRIFIILDALDEVDDDNSREALIGQVRALQPTARLMVTSRPSDITKQLLDGATTLEITASPVDLRSYVENRLARSSRLQQHTRADEMLAEEIKRNVVDNAKHMFLIAKLHMDSLESKPSRKGIRQALQSLPIGLDATYDDALSRIAAQNDDDHRLAIQILSWITFAVRPLWLNELQEAVAVEPYTHLLDEDNLPDDRLLTSVCAGLVRYDRNSGIIRLCHKSAEDYLRRTRVARFPTAARDIARNCITCLLYREYQQGPESQEKRIVERILGRHLYDYATVNWGKHVQGAPEKELLDLALSFLASKENVACAVQSAYFIEHWFTGQSQRYPKNVTALHLAAQYGLGHIARVLLAQGHDITERDSNGESVLHKAAKSGQEDLVRLLLEAHADLSIQDDHGMTALHKAASSGNNTVVLLLLEHGAAISEAKDGRTPLHLAAEFGCQEIAVTLFGKGADVNAESVPYGEDFIELKFHAGRTPLHWAAANGYHDLVRFLIVEKGAKVDATNSTLRTPLQEAIFLGHTPVVEVLLELGASVDRKDNEGWTTLHEAAWRSPGRVTELLLKQGAELEPRTNAHQGSIPYPFIDTDEVLHGNNTPLHLAACCANFEAFTLLLERGASLMSSDAKGLMALHMAAFAGHASIILEIVDAGFDVNTKDMVKKETALHKATRQQHGDCMTLLLNHGADPKIENIHDQTADEIADVVFINRSGRFWQGKSTHRDSQGGEEAKSQGSRGNDPPSARLSSDWMDSRPRGP